MIPELVNLPKFNINVVMFQLVALFERLDQALALGDKWLAFTFLFFILFALLVSLLEVDRERSRYLYGNERKFWAINEEREQAFESGID